MKRIPNTKCTVCHKKIYRRPSQLTTRVYCSRSCCGKDQRIDKTCKICQKIYCGTKNTCSRSCANKNRAIEGYKGQPVRDKSKRQIGLKSLFAYNHCILCGYNKYEVLVVHHIKPRAIGGNDDFGNLMLICPNCHGEIHQGLRDMEGRTLAS